MSGKRIAGALAVTINGMSYDVADKVSYSVSSVKKESMIGLTGVAGYKEMPVAASIKMTLRDVGFSIKAFELLTAATIVIALANGKTVTGSNMYLTDAIEADAGEGTFEVSFEGATVIEF